jgi:hypothetical protein
MSEFDAEETVAEYRAAIAMRDAETAGPWKQRYEAIAQQLRDAWKAWRGEDSLHEMAFREPE